LYIAFSSQRQAINPLYEITIGASTNTATQIKKQMQGKSICYYPKGIPNNKNINKYKIQIDKNRGYITIYINNSQFAQCKDTNFLKTVQWFSFSSWTNDVYINNVQSLALKKH